MGRVWIPHVVLYKYVLSCSTSIASVASHRRGYVRRSTSSLPAPFYNQSPARLKRRYTIYSIVCSYSKELRCAGLRHLGMATLGGKTGFLLCWMLTYYKTGPIEA